MPFEPLSPEEQKVWACPVCGKRMVILPNIPWMRSPQEAMPPFEIKQDDGAQKWQVNCE